MASEQQNFHRHITLTHTRYTNNHIYKHIQLYQNQVHARVSFAPSNRPCEFNHETRFAVDLALHACQSPLIRTFFFLSISSIGSHSIKCNVLHTFLFSLSLAFSFSLYFFHSILCVCVCLPKSLFFLLSTINCYVLKSQQMIDCGSQTFSIKLQAHAMKQGYMNVE